MKNRIYLFLIPLIIFFPFISASALENCTSSGIGCLNIQLDILPYNYTGFFVVSDSIYFMITLHNENNDSTMSDILSVRLLDPIGNEIYSDNLNITLTPGETKIITSKGGLEGERSAIQLNLLGVYTLSIKDNKYYFYETFPGGGWIRYTNEFSHSFDTMPKWQYDLWASEQNSNSELINLTRDLKGSLDRSSDSSDKMYKATIILLIIGLIQILFIASQVISSKASLTSFLKIVLAILFVIVLSLLTIALIISLTTDGFSLPSRLISTFIIMVAIIFVFRDFIKGIRNLNRNNLDNFR